MLHTLYECCRLSNMADKERRVRFRAIATAFVTHINEATFCAECGEQPVEWHNYDHCNNPNARVSSLRSQGASVARIQHEMDISTPLCRGCHMRVDGRAARLRENAPYQKGLVYVTPKPCSCCELPYKPLRLGMCSSCYNHHSGLRIRKNRTICDGCCTL